MPRKEKNIHYIYKTTCNVTKKYYIGMHSTSDIDDGYMGSGKRLRYSIRKYGKENHTKEILEFFDTREELIEAEKRMITEEHLTHDLCMNLMSGGTGGFISINNIQIGGDKCFHVNNVYWKNEDNRKKLDNIVSEYLKAKWADNLYREKMLLVAKSSFKDKKHSSETRRLMSKAREGKFMGEDSPQYGTCWITKDGINKKIKKGDLDIWITNNWNLGRILNKK